MSNILSLDPSLRCTGWVVFDEGFNLLDYGVVQTKKETSSVGESDYKSCFTIVSELDEIIKKFDITKVITEAPGGGQSSSGVKALSLVKGLIVALTYSRNCILVPELAGTIKKTLTGFRHATKEQVAEEVFKAYPEIETRKFTKVQKEAVVDAIAVGLDYKLRKEQQYK